MIEMKGHHLRGGGVGGGVLVQHATSVDNSRSCTVCCTFVNRYILYSETLNDAARTSWWKSNLFVCQVRLSVSKNEKRTSFGCFCHLTMMALLFGSTRASHAK
jgi:hypothetical protein